MTKKVAILGAGISGLACGWYLKKKFPDISLTIFEKTSRPGGLINTVLHQGSLFEWGPRSLRAHDANAALALIDEMDLTSELIEASSHAKQRYILHAGQLVPLPTSFMGLFSCPLTRECLPALLKDLIIPRTTQADESIYDFFARRFSKKVADYFIDPLMKGIYAGDAKELSMQVCFPKIWEMPRSVLLGSINLKKKKKGIVTLKRGMGSLVNALADKLQKEIRFNAEIDSFDSYDQVISTLPAHALSAVLFKTHLKELLKEIPFKSVGVVHLGYARKVNPYEGFGYLIPTSEKESVLGVIFDSSVFPEQGEATRLTVMIGENGDLKNKAIQHVKRVLGIQEKPIICEAAWMQNAIPQYPVGYLDYLEKIIEAKKEFPKLSLLGTSFHGISMNQAIYSSFKFVNNLNY